MTPTLVFWTGRLFEALVNGFAPGLLVAAVVWAATLSRARVSASTRFLLLWLALTFVIVLPLAALKPQHAQSVPISTLFATPITAPPFPATAAFPPPTLNPPSVSVPPLVQTSRSSHLAETQQTKNPPVVPITRAPSPSGFQALWSYYVAPYWSLAAAALWLTGTLIFLFRLGWGFLRLAGWKKTCRPADGRAAAFFQECVEKARVSRPVRLGFSPHPQTPVLAGLGSPCILFPESLWEQLGETEREQVLLHELAHLRRWDDWTNLAEHLLSALFFFHPVVRWLCVRLRLEREIACDDWVLASGQPTRAYALCLARLAELATTSAPHYPAPALWFSRAQLSRRVGLLLEPNRNGRTSPSARLIAVTAATLGLASLAAVALFPLIAFATERPAITPIPQQSLPQSSGPTNTINHPHPGGWRSHSVFDMFTAKVKAQAEYERCLAYKRQTERKPVEGSPQLVLDNEHDEEWVRLHNDLQVAEQRIALLDAIHTNPGQADYREAKAELKIIQSQVEEKTQAYAAGRLALVRPLAAKSKTMEEDYEAMSRDGLPDVYAPDIELAHRLELLRMTAHADFAYWGAWSQQLDEMPETESRQVVLAASPDKELTGLFDHMHTIERQVAALDGSERGPGAVEARAAKAMLETARKQIDDKIHGMKAAFKIRTRALRAGYESISNEISRLDIKKKLAGADASKTQNICQSEFHRINTQASSVVQSTLYTALTNTPAEELRSIILGIDQEELPLQTIDDRLLPVWLKWHSARLNLAMLQACGLDPKSDKIVYAQSHLQWADAQVDRYVQDKLEKIRWLADLYRDAHQGHATRNQPLRENTTSREPSPEPR